MIRETLKMLALFLVMVGSVVVTAVFEARYHKNQEAVRQLNCTQQDDAYCKAILLELTQQ